VSAGGLLNRSWAWFEDDDGAAAGAFGGDAAPKAPCKARRRCNTAEKKQSGKRQKASIEKMLQEEMKLKWNRVLSV